jgi:glutaredoxin 3|tara:strand:- start:619 stop:867 length:249 start_codon:yes stop_codon:yes gene_type:complete
MATPGAAMIYTRAGCPYCNKIEEVFRAKGWPYTKYSLGAQFTREQFYKEFGPGSTFPQVIIAGKRTGGCTETVKYLREGKFL